jgi:hypothetical protein
MLSPAPTKRQIVELANNFRNENALTSHSPHYEFMSPSNMSLHRKGSNTVLPNIRKESHVSASFMSPTHEREEEKYSPLDMRSKSNLSNKNLVQIESKTTLGSNMQLQSMLISQKYDG